MQARFHAVLTGLLWREKRQSLCQLATESRQIGQETTAEKAEPTLTAGERSGPLSAFC